MIWGERVLMKMSEDGKFTKLARDTGNANLPKQKRALVHLIVEIYHACHHSCALYIFWLIAFIFHRSFTNQRLSAKRLALAASGSSFLKTSASCQDSLHSCRSHSPLQIRFLVTRHSSGGGLNIRAVTHKNRVLVAAVVCGNGICSNLPFGDARYCKFCILSCFCPRE